MGNLLKGLPLGMFFLCHQSYIVNINNLTREHVEAIRSGETLITMQNGSKCEFAKKKINTLLKILDNVRVSGD